MARICFFTRRNLICLLSTILIPGNIYIASAAPEGGAVRAGSAQITQQGSSTLIRQSSPRAVIDWRSFGINTGERVQFSQPSSSSAILNRVTGEKVSVILGRMDANGHVFLVNPNGIIFGKGAQINVGSLIASTSNLSNDNFMQGRLVFDQPGRPGAGIANYGSITAAEGGLIALVAPHVRNDGIIQARLGKVVLGAADTFTIDFYGDGLINFALSEASLSQLRDASGGALIEQAGTIDVSGGRAVLVSAEAAKGMLDSLINMSGTIIADSAVQQGGSIVLLARGGSAQVSGTLSSRGTTGGLIEVLGGQVHLWPGARLDADGLYGGGVIHVGGAWQGAEGTYRSQFTQIDSGTFLTSSAIESGNGGEVVAWSDRDTIFSGSIMARGGALSGNGGAVEVSGKGQLSFNGFVDASAANGKAGSLLLDPYDLTLGVREAGIMSRVLRTGTSVSVSADHDINLNYAVDGRGRASGGGVTLSAGHDINLNDYLVTSNGAINLFAAAGTVRVAPGKVVHAGTAPITVRSGTTLYSAPYLTGGRLTLASTSGSVNIDYPVESFIGDLVIQAAADVNVSQPVVSLMDGNSVSMTAGNSININALVDGRPAFGIDPAGTVTMTAGQNIGLNKSIIAHDINLTATAGTITSPTMKDGTVTVQPNGIPLGEGLFAGTGPISVTAGGDLSSGVYVTTGPVSIRSTGGNVNIDTKLAEVLGNVTIKANSGSVNIDQEIANIRSGRNLTVTAGSNINLNRQIDALDDSNPLSINPVPGGSVNFTAGNNINLNKDLMTYNGPVDVNALAGTLNIAWNDAESRTYRIGTGAAPIKVTTGGDLTTGTAVPDTLPAPDRSILDSVPINQRSEVVSLYIADMLKSWVAFSTTGKLILTSTGGDVTVTGPLPATTGEISINAANAIVVDHKVYSKDQPITLTSGPGGIKVNDRHDDYGIPTQLANLDPPIYGIIIGYSPAINPGNALLTLRSEGPVSITKLNGIATKEFGSLLIDTRDKILKGLVYNDVLTHLWPSEITIIADRGIGSIEGSAKNFFEAGYSPRITVRSLYGDIYLRAGSPGILDITANAGSVYTGEKVGLETTIKAGTNINLDSAISYGGTINLIARNDVLLNSIYFAKSLDVLAGRDVSFDFTRTPDPESRPSLWFEGGGINIAAGYQIGSDWTAVRTNGNLVSTAIGGKIAFNGDSAVYIGDTEAPYNRYGLTLQAHGNIDLRMLETYGPVSIKSTATAPAITLWNPIGPEYRDTIDPIEPRLNQGIASFTLNSPGSGTLVNMEGVRAEGDVSINIGGTLNTARQITSNTGTVSLTSGTPIINPAVDIGFQEALEKPSPPAPPFAPGPNLATPGPLIALTALPAQPPGAVSVPETGVPAGASQMDVNFDPKRWVGTGTVGEVIPGEETEDDGQPRKTLQFSGGRGLTREADLGQR